METFSINLEEGLSAFKWDKDSILNHVDASTPCKDIFQAACNEIGRFYQAKGFKYSPSSHKLEYQYKDFKIKFIFSSSRYNTLGERVGFEVNSAIYPVKLEKQYKATKHPWQPVILTNVGLLDEIMPDREAGTVQGVSIFGEINEIKDDRYNYALRRYNRYSNIYNISIEQFRKLLEYMNLVISFSFELLLNPERLVQYINNAHEDRFYDVKDERFIDYLHLYHGKESNVYKTFLAKYRELEGKEYAAS